MSATDDTRVRGADELTAELAAHQLATVQELARQTDRLSGLLHRMTEPADLRTVVLSSSANPVEDPPDVESRALSLGVYNPAGNPATAFAGIAGGSATAAARAFPVPAGALIVVPVAVAQLEVGMDPTALGAATAVVFVFRFKSVQPAFAGRVA